MREYSTPLRLTLPEVGTLSDDVDRNAAEHPATVVLRRHVDGAWHDVDAAAFRREVRECAKGLVAAGVQVGDRVALMASTRWEWTVLDYAIWYAGGVGVPLYPSASAEQMAWVLADSGASALVVESPEHLARLASVREQLPDLVRVWSLASNAVPTLVHLGEDVDDADLDLRRDAVDLDDAATIIYTSGTTGRPKGCTLSHRHFMIELDVALDGLSPLFADPTAPEDGDDAPDGRSTLLFLPLAHVLARIIQVGCIRSRTTLAHCSSLAAVPVALRAVRPTFVLAVPRVFETLFNTASQQATADGHGAMFERAADTAIAWSRAQESGRVPLRLRARHAAYARLVYGRLREQLGGRCRWAVSGGAPLGERLGHFYRGIGITVLEGWGLTETTGAATVNLPDALKIGTVGRPLAGTAVRVADDGELLVRGGQVFGGYHGDPVATEAVLERDGWLHTGDVGEVDDEGFVRVTGRKTEILVTAGGKSVAPAGLEDLVRAHPLVSHCLVVGDGRAFVAALVTLDRETLPWWAESRGLPEDPARLAVHPDLLAELQSAVDAANRAVSKAEAIRRFGVVPGEWTEETGELTPSLKLRRSVVMRRYRDDVARLYED